MTAAIAVHRVVQRSTLDDREIIEQKGALVTFQERHACRKHRIELEKHALDDAPQEQDETKRKTKNSNTLHAGRVDGCLEPKPRFFERMDRYFDQIRGEARARIVMFHGGH